MKLKKPYKNIAIKNLADLSPTWRQIEDHKLFITRGIEKIKKANSADTGNKKRRPVLEQRLLWNKPQRLQNIYIRSSNQTLWQQEQ